MNRRKLLYLREAIDGAPIPQRETMRWMARMLGPEKLNGDYSPFPCRKRDICHLMLRAEGNSFERLYWEGLPPKWRIVLEMRREGLPYADIGMAFGQSAKNMRRIECRALRMLMFRVRICKPIEQKTFDKFHWLFARMGLGVYEDLIKYQNKLNQQS
jgi:hypothetical protein